MNPPDLAWKLPLVLLTFCMVLVSCRLESEILTVVIENKCDETIVVRVDSWETWNSIDANQAGGTIASGMDENGRMAPPLELHVALVTKQGEDPSEWDTYTITHEDLEIRKGENSSGSSFEAVAVVEQDLCPS